MSKVYRIRAVQKIPMDIDAACDFFSSPLNLRDITPARLDFKVIAPPFSEKIYPGQIIEYHIKPLLGIKLYWMTEIIHVQDKAYFVDEQRFGPYSLWHHQHHFKEIEGGIEMTDLVHYKLPLWFMGDVANTLFVRKQLQEIFVYRYNAIEQKFGNWANGMPDITFG